MQQDSWDRDTFDQLRDRSKPGLPNNFQEQTRLRRMILQDPSAQICRGLRYEARAFWVVMQKNQAGGNEQCCATSVFVLHLLWAAGYTECRANQTSCEESEITFHASNGGRSGAARFWPSFGAPGSPRFWGGIRLSASSAGQRA